ALDDDIEYMPTQGIGALLAGDTHGAADGSARLAGRGDALPVCRWHVIGVGYDFDLFATAQLRDKGHDGAIDLGTHAHVTKFGVHCIGKIDRSGPPWQRDQASARAKAKDLILKEFQ